MSQSIAQMQEGIVKRIYKITKCLVPGDCATECPGMGIDSWYDDAFYEQMKTIYDILYK